MFVTKRCYFIIFHFLLCILCTKWTHVVVISICLDVSSPELKMDFELEGWRGGGCYAISC